MSRTCFENAKEVNEYATQFQLAQRCFCVLGQASVWYRTSWSRPNLAKPDLAILIWPHLAKPNLANTTFGQNYLTAFGQPYLAEFGQFLLTEFGQTAWSCPHLAKPHLAKTAFGQKNPNLAKKIRIWPGRFRDRIWPNRIWPILVF